jgi:hypothetical protein
LNYELEFMGLEFMGIGVHGCWRRLECMGLVFMSVECIGFESWELGSWVEFMGIGGRLECTGLVFVSV